MIILKICDIEECEENGLNNLNDKKFLCRKINDEETINMIESYNNLRFGSKINIDPNLEKKLIFLNKELYENDETNYRLLNGRSFRTYKKCTKNDKEIGEIKKSDYG